MPNQELRITAEVAVRLFNVWMARLEARPSQRSAENGVIRLDTVPSEPGAVHHMDGSIVRVYYKAANAPTARAVREAEVATQVLGLSRRVYTGRLIDIKRGADGTVYFKVRTVERRDESNGGQPAYRAFNPSKGQLLEMVINPHEHETLNLQGR